MKLGNMKQGAAAKNVLEHIGSLEPNKFYSKPLSEVKARNIRICADMPHPEDRKESLIL